MAREASFTFIPESQLTSTRIGKDYTASVSGKYGYLRLSLDYIRDKNLHGKFVKLYADKQKKAIGWRVMKESSLAGLDGYREIKITQKKQGKYVVDTHSMGIGSIIKALGLKDKVFNKKPIQVYKEQGMLGDEYHYIQLT